MWQGPSAIVYTWFNVVWQTLDARGRVRLRLLATGRQEAHRVVTDNVSVRVLVVSFVLVTFSGVQQYTAGSFEQPQEVGWHRFDVLGLHVAVKVPLWACRCLGLIEHKLAGCITLLAFVWCFEPQQHMKRTNVTSSPGANSVKDESSVMTHH